MRFPLLAFILLLCTCVSAQNDDRKVILRSQSAVAPVQGPLFIVDGAHLEEGAVSDLDPERIESITVYKDARATTLYGTAAANGVVVIDTKEGNYTRADYTLSPGEIPGDIFTRYAELNFGSGKELVFLLNGKPHALKKLQKLDATTIESIRVYEGGEKAKRLGHPDKEMVVVVTLY